MRTAKYCLKLETALVSKSQEKQECFRCDECDKTFTQKVSLQKHKCKPKLVPNKLFRESVELCSELESEITVLREQVAELKGRNAATSECLEKSMNRPTYSMNRPTYSMNRPTYSMTTTNIAKQVNALQPITDQLLKDSIDELPIDVLSKGGKCLGRWATAANGILNNRAICTDHSRKTFVWKDGEDSKAFRDVKGHGLAHKFFEYIHNQKSDELKKWIKSTEQKLEISEEEDPNSTQTELLKTKLIRACRIKSDCHTTASEGETTTLSKEFVNTISMALSKSNPIDFIEDVVTEMLIEEGELPLPGELSD
jgi:hypothetical protein